MALVNGTEYYFIDMQQASGGNTTRHLLKDTNGRAMIAPTEASSTASAAHAKGSYFIYGTTLYQATADIASGGTITPNTNCKAVALSSEVSDLKSAFGVFDIALQKLEVGIKKDTQTLTPTLTPNTAINYSTGKITTGLSDNYASTDFILINFATLIANSFWGYGVYGYAFYDIFGNYIDGGSYNLSIDNLPENACYIRFTDYTANGTHPSKTVTISNDYTLTQGVVNIINEIVNPIDERTTPKVLSNNKLDLSQVETGGYYYYSNGSWISRTDISSSGLIPVSPNEKYILCALGAPPNAVQVTYWDDDEHFVPGTGADISSPTKWTVPNNSNIKYMRLSLYNDYITKYYLNIGETDLGYDHYKKGISYNFDIESPNIKETEDKIANIGSKYVHFSLDDCTFWSDLTQNSASYTSIFDNSFLNDLKDLHDQYGMCFTLLCFIVDGSASIENVTNKFATEFSENKSWLRFGFHGTTDSETFDNSDPLIVKGYYDTFVSGIYRMTGDYECIDRVTRLSSFSGNKNVCLALRNANCGISGLLCNDNNAGSYYLTSDQWGYVNSRCKLFDAETQLTFIHSITRMESPGITLSTLGSIDLQNALPIYELFTHETLWTTAIKNKIDSFASWLKEHNFTFAYPQNILNL